MSKIVVAKLVRLGKDGDSFSKKLEAAVLRTNAKIDDEYLNGFNANWKTSGQLYIVDEKATKEREEALAPKKVGRPKKEETEK